MARTENPLTSPVTDYYHADMIGTTRLMTTSTPPPGTPTAIEPAVYTAFGERINPASVTDSTRYGYAGAWGYQAHADFPFLHVGARYYDPSSGRFLQRDPIGIRGGPNVYGYADARPVSRIDPWGLWNWEEGLVGAGTGLVVGSRFPGLLGTIVGGAAGLLTGGYESGDAKRLGEGIKETIDDLYDRRHPKPAPRPPANKTPRVFERPWDEKYRGPYSSSCAG